MGEVSERMTKKKKKGRPSLLDLQKRSLKKQQQQQQQQPQNLNLIKSHSDTSRGPTSRKPVPRFTRTASEGIAGDDDDERKEKKHKLLVGLNSHLHNPTSLANSLSSNSWNEDGADPEAEATHKRRKIDVFHPGSDETDGKVPKATDGKHGSQGEAGPTTPLPDKKLLVFILDRLQKKDTHGVFSEPVDPEELPDYHDIIKHPMDFGTVRKKLEGGLYTNLEQFENDVFLICSNAMQYNSPDTIYYRQARAMQEMARKDLENLRQDSDDSEPQPKVVQRGRPPGKRSRKSLGMSPLERVGPESSSDATLASGGDITVGSNGYNLRRGHNKFQPAESSARAPYSNFNSGGYASWVSEWENEFPASVLKAVFRYGMKHSMVDENRRHTYKHPVASGNEPPLLATIEDEFKQLLAVGLHVKHGYARSLALFAADLGPVVWQNAARKIRSVLPIGHEFGPGWIAEDDVSQRQHFPFCSDDRTLDSHVPEDYGSKFPSPSGSFPLANRSCLQSGDMVLNGGLNYQNELNPLNNVGGVIESMAPLRIQQEPMVHSDDYFGSNGRVGSDFSPQMKMVRLADLTGSPSVGNVPQNLGLDPRNGLTSYNAPKHSNLPYNAQFLNNLSPSDSSNLLPRESGFELQCLSQGLAGKSSWQGLEVTTKHNTLSIANDINGKIGTTNSPSSNVEVGHQLQPNLALQL